MSRVLSGQLWPIHLKPYNDELLSSWLVRLSRAYGTEPRRFCLSIWHRHRFWHEDIDQGRSDDILQVLVTKTATPLVRAQATTFSGYPGLIGNELVGPGARPWLLMTRVRSGPRRSPWLQYCPQCLQDDVDPYFRRYWRLAFVTVCVKHHRRLLDSCPSCGHSINFHRLEAKTETMTLCYRCHFDLRQAQAPTLGDNAVYHRLVQSQTRWIEAMEQGHCVLPGPQAIDAKDYFFVLRQLGQILINRKQARQWRQTFCHYLQQPDFEPHFSGPKRHVIEVLPVTDRWPLMLLLSGWLDQWPERFVTMCEKANMQFIELVRGMPVRPAWYLQAARQVGLHL